MNYLEGNGVKFKLIPEGEKALKKELKKDENGYYTATLGELNDLLADLALQDLDRIIQNFAEKASEELKMKFVVEYDKEYDHHHVYYKSEKDLNQDYDFRSKLGGIMTTHLFDHNVYSVSIGSKPMNYDYSKEE